MIGLNLPNRPAEPAQQQASQRMPQHERDALEMVDKHQDWAQAFRRRSTSGLSIEDEMEQNGQRFIGNHWLFASRTANAAGLHEGYRFFQFGENESLKGIYKSTLNRTGPALLSNVSTKMQQPMVVKWSPAETSGDTRYWLSKEGGAQLHQLIQSARQEIEQARQQMIAESTGDANELQEIEQMAEVSAQEHLSSLGLDGFKDTQLIGDGENGPSERLTRQQAGRVKTLIADDQLEESDLISVNDTLRAKCAQDLWDNRWNIAEGERYVLMNEFLCETFGCQPFRFQWNTETHCFEIENTHILNVWIDPTHDNIAKSGYLIFDHSVTAEHAHELLPEDVSTSEIEKAKGKDLQNRNYRRAALWKGEHAEENVIIRTAWFRHQEVPMTVDEALEAGAVTREPKVDEQTGEPIPGEYRYFLTETFGEGEEGAEPIGLDDDGNELFAEPEQIEVEPQEDTHHNTLWPNTRGIRQIVSLPGLHRVVQDMRCPYLDFPFSWNVNIPRPDGSPYGIGLPAWVEDISQQINRLLSVIDNYSRYYQFPQMFMPQGLYDKLKGKGFQLHSRPGMVVPIPDQQWQEVIRNGGFNAMVQDIPTIPSMLVQVFEKLLEQHDKLSGSSEVRRGNAPYSGASGSLVNTLAEQSAGTLSFSSKFTEAAVKRGAMICMDMMVKWMPVEEIGKVLNRFERPVLADIVDGLENTEWNVNVEIASGRGVNRQVDEERALALFERGLLSRRSAMERLGVEDADDELRKINEDQSTQAQGAAPVQAAAAAQMDQVTGG